MKWEITKVKMEEFQALDESNIGYILNIRRKFLWFYIEKTVRTTLPYSYEPKIGNFLNS